MFRPLDSGMWMLGCGLLSMVACVGACVVLMVAVPLVFRVQTAETQARIVRFIPFLSVLQPTREYTADVLPTIDWRTATARSGDLAGVATIEAPRRPTSTREPLPTTFQVQNVKWEAQGFNNCGPANMVQTLHILGTPATQSDVAAILKPNRNDANVSPWQLVEYTSQYTSFRAIARVNGDVDLLKRLVYAQMGVIIESGWYDDNGDWEGHYLTILGWDDNAQVMLTLDSLRGGEYARGVAESYVTLDEQWKHFNRVFVVIYRPDQESKLRGILGDNWDANLNAQSAVQRALAETQLNPGDGFAWFNLGSSYTMINEYGAAAAAYDRSFNLQLPYRMMWYQFGPYKAYYEVGDYQQVVDLATTSLQTTKYIEETFYYRGLALAALGQMPAAQADLQTAADFNPRFSYAQTALLELNSGTRPAPQFLL
jgi:hypothetical protein